MCQENIGKIFSDEKCWDKMQMSGFGTIVCTAKLAAGLRHFSRDNSDVVCGSETVAGASDHFSIQFPQISAGSG